MSDVTIDKAHTILFLCRCSTNISKYIDFDAIKKWAKDNKDISVVVTANLLCSPREKLLFAKIIKERKIRSIVIAACSPRLHEKTFQDIAEKEGINMSKVQIANIREQCAWVTHDKGEATHKAISLINAAVKRSLEAEDLFKNTTEVNTDVLIIGGGIAGMKAALTLAEADRKVYLVEKDISLGGFLVKTEYIAPSMECAACFMAPVLTAVRDHPNIDIITNADVTEVIGFLGNFSARILKKARFVDDTCIACDACFDVCPVAITSNFQQGMGEHKAIYKLFPGSVPAACTIDKKHCKHFTDEACSKCSQVCPFSSINYNDTDEEIVISIGAIIVATGFQDGSLTNFPEFGYKQLDNIFTITDFERLASANGPTNGKVLMRNGESPQSIAVIHCAGSLDPKGLPYCSGICCSNALKVGLLARKANPDIRVFNVYHQLVFPHPADQRFFDAQVEDGTQMVRCLNLSSIKVSKSDFDKLLVMADGMHICEVDMVVLVTGLGPPDDLANLSGMLHVDRNADGYLVSDHDILHSTGTVIDGVYVAGCAASSCNAGDSVVRAYAAAGDILSKLIPGREIDLEVMTSFINQDQCAGCKVCISVCPYKAIFYDSFQKVSKVNESICRGCGTCAVACASGALQARHYDDTQIMAEIGGLLDI